LSRPSLKALPERLAHADGRSLANFLEKLINEAAEKEHKLEK
jgi:hypothetical protein